MVPTVYIYLHTDRHDIYTSNEELSRNSSFITGSLGFLSPRGTITSTKRKKEELDTCTILREQMTILL